jgi:uncharacterized protein (TIGR00369 family)
MPAFEAQDSAFETRVRGSFARQRVMQAIGASLMRVSPGEVEIVLPFREDLTQQHGFLHAGIVSTIADSACGYAAYSLMPADAAVLTVEYKVNFLSPAQGDRMIARARVTKPGRTVTVCTCDVFAVMNGKERIVATMLGTIMAVRDRESLVG